MTGKTLLVLSVATLLMGTSAHGAKLRSACQLLEKDGEKIQGTNTEVMYEIASVSKVFTALWATKVLGLDHRFETKLHVTAAGEDSVDLHIEGDMDPLFNAWQMQFVIAELNKVNVKKIRNLTFDENFAFMVSTRSGVAVSGNITPRDPNPAQVKAQLQAFKENLYFSYSPLRERLKAHDIQMPSGLSFSVQSIEHVKKAEFAPTTETVTYTTKSLPLQNILHEMNRSSNNWAANTIFEGLGGAEKFKEFAEKELGLDGKDVSFINGSGDSWVPEAGAAKKYNKATCAAVLAATVHLSEAAEAQGRQLSDVMAVAGHDAASFERSTVSKIYNNEITEHSLIAKTGTVNPSISLAGTVETQDGRVYFGYIYAGSTTRQGQRDARNQIRLDLIKLIQSHKGSRELKDLAAVPVFTQVDKESLLKKVDSQPEVKLTGIQ